MKNKLVLLLLVLLTLVGLGCGPESKVMHIEAKEQLIIQQSQELKVYYHGTEVPLENLQWTLSDYNVASIENGTLYGKNYGTVVVGVVDKNDTTHYCSKTIEIVPPFVEDIVVTGVTQMYVNKTTTLEAKVVPSIIEDPITWESSDETILIVDEGDILAVGVGIADVIIKCDDFEKRYQIEVLPTPTSVTITGKNSIAVNEVAYLTFNIEEEVTLTSSNEDIVTVVDNTIVGVKAGTATITAVKNIDPSVKGTIEITVTELKNQDIEMTEEEKDIVNEIIANMTIEQMVGEMFGIGFEVIQNGWGEQIQVDPTTGLPNAQFNRYDPVVPMLEFLAPYKFGNFTIHSESGKDRKTLQLAVNTLKDMAITNTGVEPFISINSTGGFIMSGVTSLPTNMALSNAKASTIQKVNELYSSELRALGINSVVNKYVCNNQDINSVLNTYGNSVTRSMAVATIASKGLQSNGVVMVPELSELSYYSEGRTIEEIKATDWKLIETAIKNGSQMISLPASIYIESSNTYYGVLSKEFLKDYIRGSLNYDGIVLMGNDAVRNLMYDENAKPYLVQAINLGVDMISFDLRVTNSYWGSTRTEVDNLLSLYNHIVNAAQNLEIPYERLKEAVSRILLVKLRNNILNDETDYSNFNYNKVSSAITNYAPEFITTVGEKFVIDKEDDVLVISEDYDTTGTKYSLGDNVRSFFEVRGYKNIDIYHAGTLTPSVLIQNAKNYDKIFIAVSTMSENKNIGFAASRIKFIDFVNQMLEQNPNVCIIATGMPSALNYLPNIKNSILLYSYYEDNFESLCKVLNGEV